VSRTVGVFVIGALGDVATTAVVGAAALARRLAPPIGLVTELEDFKDADLVPYGSLRFGGLDVRTGDLVESARALTERHAAILPPDLVAQVEPELREASTRIGAGFLHGAAAPIVEMATTASKEMTRLTPEAAIDAVRESIRQFREGTKSDTVVVVQLASTERADERVPASVLYARAAIEERCAYVNFTPSRGAWDEPLRARAKEVGVPLAGRDGKTGETLLKSVLAPMFAARHLKVLSWAGYNILGNRDGQALDDPRAKAAKLKSKGSTLGAILGPDKLGSEHVAIEYVPSIGDWKTAWDHIHFEGFLGTRMALELTWRGADSALAAPLVLDLVRLIERAARAGRRGPVPELAAFFKDPMDTEQRAFGAQMDMLRALAGDLCRT
jgi:myo-inositol-1-phosphate synthase